METNEKTRNNGFLMRLIKGAIIGVAGILPGASGGVLAVSMGIYRPTLDFIANIFKNFKPAFIFLLPLGLGGVLGLFGTSWLVEFLMGNYRIPTMYALIGMVAGGVPSFLVEANKEGGFKPKYLIITLISAAITIAIAVADKLLTEGTQLPFNGWTAALSGALIAIGTVIPGISTSFIMMYLGIYEPLLASLNSLNIPILGCAVAGGLVVILLTISWVQKMFNKHHALSHYAVLGLLVGSVVIIFPGLPTGWMLPLCVALLLGGFFGTKWLCSKDDR